MEYFGIRRTDMKVGQTFQGVETASQIRYVGYYEKIKRDFGGNPPPEKELRVRKVIINSIAGLMYENTKTSRTPRTITLLNFHSISGVGRGNGSDLMMQILIQKNEILRCNFGEEYNCKVKE